ncbi:hypothetical protein D1007_19040 [Hordeum vulgare]|nr:hypothetical protein D1007_19040 [Hordeum vulgare]
MSKLQMSGRLYVDDMAPGTGDADLLHHFGRYGDVADIFVPTDRLTGAPRCCAFVQFSSPHDARRALADPSHVIKGREGTSDADLRHHFGRYGEVTDIFIPTYRLTGQPRCCAFVQFSNLGDADRALAEQHQIRVINGRQVYIAQAQPRHLEESSVYQYKPLCERQVRNGPWRGYRVGDIGKTSRGSLVCDSIIAYISEDGVYSWARPIRMHTESKSTGNEVIMNNLDLVLLTTPATPAERTKKASEGFIYLMDVIICYVKLQRGMPV